MEEHPESAKDVMERRTSHLVRLIDDLLDVSDLATPLPRSRALRAVGRAERLPRRATAVDITGGGRGQARVMPRNVLSQERSGLGDLSGR